MKTLFKSTLLIWGVMTFYSLEANSQNVPKKQPNILFIAVDDLRPELGAYGKSYVKTPHLDRFSKESTVFSNHFVTVPTCGASRYSMLVGKLPSSKGDLSNMAAVNNISKKSPQERPLTFIQNLKENGYYTVGIGKISHHPDGYVYEYDEPKSDLIELPGTWDEMLFDSGKWGTGHNAFFGYADGNNRTDLKKQVKPYEAGDVDDVGYPDGLTAELAINKLGELKNKQEPFFLGVGFFKPHLPFTSPKKYWDLYEESEIPLAPFPGIPEKSTKASLIESGEFNQYALGEEKASLDHAVSDEYAKKIRHAYLASVSYVDAQIGKVLEELEKQGLAENTIVVVWGDHGWHLGDDLVWGKHTLFDWALRSVLMIKVPDGKGNYVDQVVSSVDIAPTLLELADVEISEELDGESMVSLLKNPKLNSWRNTAFSYFRQGNSLRTSHYRLTRYFRESGPEYELYDEVNDSNETKNIAATNLELVPKLKELLELGNTGIYEKK